MTKILKSLAMQVPQIRRLVEDNRRLREENTHLRQKADTTILEGTAYSRYAIPVDYLPSRDFNPRWGHKCSGIPQLENWFRGNVDRYFSFIKVMRDFAPNLAHIPIEFNESNLPQPAWSGVPYCPFDALALYTMIRTKKPKIYFEIGSGITTCFAHKAIRDGNLPTRIISVDPEPRAKINPICDQIIREGLEKCDLSIFDELQSGDILFFDGSHRSFMNSDVTVFS